MAQHAMQPEPGERLIQTRGAMDVQIRLFRDDETEAILELLLSSFGRWPGIPITVSPLDHLRWKLRLDESDERRHRLAEFDGTRVGFIVHWTRPALLKGRPVLIADGSDICVHPEFQGRGVMGALISSGEQTRKVAVCYLEGSTHPAVLSKRHEAPEARGAFGNRVERFVRPMTLRSAFGAFRLYPGRSPRKLASSAQRFAGWLARRASGRTVAPGPSVREVTVFDERTDGLWEEASRPFEFIMTRDRDYLSWRYADRRAGVFTILIAEDGERLLGYTVLSVDRAGRRGAVADVLVLPERVDAARALLREAVARMRRRGVETIECWFPERHPCRSALEDAGFIMRRRKEVSAYRATGAVPEQDLAFIREPTSRVHLTLGDIDRV